MLFNYVAGSQSYGLETPTSDVDYRGVYLLTDPTLIIDPFRYTTSSQKCEDSIKDGVDTVNYELRHFLNILRQGNTGALEMLFVENPKFSSPLFDKLRENKTKLIDPFKLYTSLKGYISSESKLAIGERTGKLGGKRYEQVTRLGFSPKNVVQLHRLAFAGTQFFLNGTFPVNMKKFTGCHEYLMRIKTKPEQFTTATLMADVRIAVKDLDEAYDVFYTDRARQYKYDQAFVTSIMLEAYVPILQQHLPKKRSILERWFKK